MSHTLVLSSFRAALDGRDPDAARWFLSEMHPADLAAALDEVPPEVARDHLALLDPDLRAGVFGYLQPQRQVELARLLGRRALAVIVSEMSADERADLFVRLSPEEQEALLPALAQAEREDVRRLVSYDPASVGAVMTSEYATLDPALTVAEAIEKLRREAPDKETIYQAYVVDADRRLVGVVSLRDLILAQAGATIGSLMTDEPISVAVDAERTEAAHRIAHYDLLAVPVVDGAGRLVGIVTHDDATDVVVEEATEDFHKAATVGKLAGNLRDAGVLLLYRKRVVWLVLLVFGNLLSGAGIAAFEDVISSYVALVFFLPLLIGSGGNAGSQASTLMVRALATGDVRMRDWGRMLGREVLVAGTLGLTMAAAVSLIGLVRGGPQVALVVASSMVVIVLIGSLIGMSLPFALNRFRLDPAAASGPLVTSIADAAGVLVYFAIASAVLPTLVA